jgi:CAAX protease family protein
LPAVHVDVRMKKHPLLTCFAATFVISWGGVLSVVALAGIPESKARFAIVVPIAIAAMLLGPSIAGVTLTGLIDGRAGVRQLLSRLTRWRVAARWYAIALLLAPLVILAMGLSLSLISPVFVPGVFATDDKTSRLLFGISAGLVVGFSEELGWTGFATPRLRLRHGILITGLIIGVAWGAWHVIGHVVFASGAYAGNIPLSLFLIARTAGFLVGSLPAYRVLTVWVYDRTGSLLVAMIMHMSLTASTMIFEPLAISGASLLISDLVSAVAWWSVVAVTAAVSRGQFSRRQDLRRAA